MTPRIEKAIDIFLDAINNGTLAKGTCSACAVGNLVAAGIGIKASIGYMWNGNGYWGDIFLTSDNSQRIRKKEVMTEQDWNRALSNVQATDFSINELAAIEFAFETNTLIEYDEYCNFSKEQVRADQIKGLAAVVKVMLEFDNCKDSVNEVFTKRAELIPIES